MSAEDQQLHVSWSEIQSFAEQLTEQIQKSDFKPEYLIGITVGGLLPLMLVSKRLGIRDISTISARSYDSTVQGAFSITALPDIDIAGKKVLLIDEIADTGITLDNISRVLHEKYKVGELRTAVIVCKSHSVFRPDYHVLDTDKWVVFPWDEGETIRS